MLQNEKIVVRRRSHYGGGEVLVGSGYMIDGETIAVLGDPVSCKIPLHGSGNIVEDPNLLLMANPLLYMVTKSPVAVLSLQLSSLN